jgi:hypothetical protein
MTARAAMRRPYPFFSCSLYAHLFMTLSIDTMSRGKVDITFQLFV